MSLNRHDSKLPPPTIHITAHDLKTGTSIIHSSKPASWVPGDPSKPTYNVLINYSTSRTPANLNDALNLKEHEAAMASGTAKGAPPFGSSFRMLDVAPGYTTSMHRTVTLDYGVVIEGMLELICDSREEVGKGEGDIRVLRRGDISVMRGTMHAFRNPSQTDWARISFVCLDIEPVELKGQKLKELWN